MVYTHKDREWLCICVQFADPIYEIQIRLLWCEEGPANAQWERERERVKRSRKFENLKGVMVKAPNYICGLKVEQVVENQRWKMEGKEWKSKILAVPFVSSTFSNPNGSLTGFDRLVFFFFFFLGFLKSIDLLYIWEVLR